MAQALYRKHRSKKLEEVIGQPHITSVLQRALQKKLVSHAYLFTGPRGVGKTSIARILAAEITGQEQAASPLDIIEIDAASNNSVEDVRDLREKVQIAPVASAKKVYIIDEVHMLSNSAFNALLKTLEEPPAHVVFILATTNPDKLPDTIISRTQHFAFKLIPTGAISEHLSKVAQTEGLKINKQALSLIAQQARGSMRDALSLLDQIVALGGSKEINQELIIDTLGLAPQQELEDLLQAAKAQNFEQIKQQLETITNQGVSGGTLLDQLLNYIIENSANQPFLIPLLAKLSEINPRGDYIDIKIMVALGEQAATNNLQAPTNPKATPAKNKQQINKQAKEVQSKPLKATTPPSISAPFNWQELIKATKNLHMALGSLVVKCHHNFQEKDNKLIIYTINNFNKKKLDDPRYLPKLHEALSLIGYPDINIETIPTAAPNLQAAVTNITEVMGGGEVVKADI